jgi:hypothetical protein
MAVRSLDGALLRLLPPYQKFPELLRRQGADPLPLFNR